MIDNRIFTFLKLCEIMNYRKTATLLNMTQPAVTQHIQGLEQLYQCKLFHYEGKTLTKTEQAIKLESYARSAVYNDRTFKAQIHSTDMTQLSIGATKTIGDYMINKGILNLLQDNSIELHYIVDNTQKLFEQLNLFQLDFLIIEGYFDKSIYDSELLRLEELVGICSPNHKFANNIIPLEELFNEHIILREEGSGTRNVLNNFLSEHNYSFKQFRKNSSISSFNLIQQAVVQDIGISFVYNAIPESNPELATFRIANHEIYHELNCVFLKNTYGNLRYSSIIKSLL